MNRFRLIGSFARLVVDLVILVLLYGIMANVVGDRLSKQLDNVDPTNEEMVQEVMNPFSAALKYLTEDLNVLLALRCGEDDPDVMSCRQAIAFLGIGQKIDKAKAREGMTYWKLGSSDETGELLCALIDALPDKEPR